MSEYTQYFAVKSSSETTVQEVLSKAQIVSIVDADKERFFFSKKYKNSEGYDWVSISCPASKSYDINSNYTYTHQADNLKGIFGELIYFFQEENMIDWLIELKYFDQVIKKRIYSNEEIHFSDSEKEIFSKCLNKSFNDLESLLLPKKGSDFLNFVGIPYLELNDKDLIPQGIANDGKYAFLPNELLE